MDANSIIHYQERPAPRPARLPPAERRDQPRKTERTKAPGPDRPLSKIDLAILNRLQRDGRISMTALGAEVGLSPAGATDRVKHLETAGYITGYSASLSLDRLGFTICQFKLVKLSTLADRAAYRFEAAIVAQFPNVIEYMGLSGEWDYYLKILTHDQREMKDIQVMLLDLPMMEKMASFNPVGLPFTQPIPAIRPVKRDDDFPA